MSFTTRCPACGTMFRVVPDQLKISDGWVRCGHCADVFDATLYLESWVPPATPPATTASAGAASPAADALAFDEVAGPGAHGDLMPDPVTAVDVPVDVAELVEPDDDEGTWLSAPVPLEVEHPPAPPAQDAVFAVLSPADAWPESAPQPPPDLASAHEQTSEPAAASSGGAVVPGLHSLLLQPDAQESDFDADLRRFAAGSATVMVEASEPADVARPVSPAIGGNGLPGDVATAAVPEPGFVRQARRRAYWSSPGMRLVLSALVVVLGGLLTLQWAVHDRDRLAAWQPEWQPALERLCEPLGCEVAPLRRIDAVVIDSSMLVRRLGQFYSFDLVLKNTQPVALAVPALELSLTDARDEVISRRVFLPSELPGAPRLLPANGSLPLSLRLSIATGDAAPMGGYRALVFYP